MRSKNVRHILIRTPNYLGDTIMSLTAIQLLRKEYPSAVFTFVCPPFFAEFFERYDFTERIVPDCTKLKKGKSSFVSLYKELKQEKYDLAILFQNSIKNALLFKFLKVKNTIGFDKEGQRFLLDFSLKKHHGIHFRNMHYQKRFAFLVNAYLGSKYKEIEPVSLKWKPYPFFIEKTKPLVALFLGNHKKQSVYPLEEGKELIEKLKETYSLVLIGGDEEMEEKNTKLAKLDENILDLTGKTNVNELIDVIGSVDALITIDSAPMHIATCIGTPCLVLLGLSSSPFSLVKPLEAKKTVYCRGNQRRIDEHKSIVDITPEEIKDSLDKLLKTKECE